MAAAQVSPATAFRRFVRSYNAFLQEETGQAPDDYTELLNPTEYSDETVDDLEELYQVGAYHEIDFAGEALRLLRIALPGLSDADLTTKPIKELFGLSTDKGISDSHYIHVVRFRRFYKHFLHSVLDGDEVDEFLSEMNPKTWTNESLETLTKVTGEHFSEADIAMGVQHLRKFAHLSDRTDMELRTTPIKTLFGLDLDDIDTHGTIHLYGEDVNYEDTDYEEGDDGLHGGKRRVKKSKRRTRGKRRGRKYRSRRNRRSLASLF